AFGNVLLQAVEHVAGVGRQIRKTRVRSHREWRFMHAEGVGSGGIHVGYRVSASVFLRGRLQPWICCWRLRATLNSPGAASRVMVDPAPTLAWAPIVTGATSEALEPMKAPSPITVRNLFTPS